MVNEYLLLNAIKTALDADATLKTLLNVKGTSSKVILGPARPTTGSNPTIQLYVSEHQVDEEAKWDRVEVTAGVYATDDTGLADVEQIANIMDRVVILMDEAVPNLAGHNEFNIGLIGFSPVGPAPNPPDGEPQHFQEARFMFRGIKL